MTEIEIISRLYKKMLVVNGINFDVKVNQVTDPNHLVVKYLKRGKDNYPKVPIVFTDRRIYDKKYMINDMRRYFDLVVSLSSLKDYLRQDDVYIWISVRQGDEEVNRERVEDFQTC